MKNPNEWSHVTFNRTMDGDDIEVFIKYQGATATDTRFVALDGIMEGIAALIVSKIGIDNLSAKLFNAHYLRIRDQFNTHLSIKSHLLDMFDKDAPLTKEERDEIDTASCYYEGVSKDGVAAIFTHEDGCVHFENEIGIGYHELNLKGTVQSIEYALSYLLFSVIINEFGVNEIELNGLFEWMETSSYEKLITHDYDPNYYDKYVNPWLDALATLE